MARTQIIQKKEDSKACKHAYQTRESDFAKLEININQLPVRGCRCASHDRRGVLHCAHLWRIFGGILPNTSGLSIFDVLRLNITDSNGYEAKALRRSNLSFMTNKRTSKHTSAVRMVAARSVAWPPHLPQRRPIFPHYLMGALPHHYGAPA